MVTDWAGKGKEGVDEIGPPRKGRAGEMKIKSSPYFCRPSSIKSFVSR